MHGIFVGEIQALEGAGRTCWDFDTGDGREQAPFLFKLDMARQCWDEARHVEISCKLADHMGSEIGEFAEQTMLYEAACNPDPVLRLTGVNRALEGLAIDVFKTMKDFGSTLQDPVLEFCEDWMLADEVTHVKMGSDWLRRLTVDDPERQKQALDFQKAVDKLFSFGGFRGEESENPVHLARNFRRLAGFTDDEIGELVDIAAEAYAEAQARSAGRSRPERSAAAVRPGPARPPHLRSRLVRHRRQRAGRAVGAGRGLAACAAHPRAVVVHRRRCRCRCSCRWRWASAWWPGRSIVAPQFHMFYGFIAIIAVGHHLLVPQPDAPPAVPAVRARRPVRDGPRHPRDGAAPLALRCLGRAAQRQARDKGHVVPDTEQEGRTARAQEVHAAEEQPRHDGAGTVIGEGEPQLVEGGEPNPAGVVGTKARGEDRDSEVTQVELTRWVGAKWRRVGQLGHRETLARKLVAQEVPEGGVAGVAEGHRLGEIVGEMGSRPSTTISRPSSCTPIACNVR